MSHDRTPESITGCAVLHLDGQGNAIGCPDRNPSITAKLQQPLADDRLRDAEIAAAVAEHEARAFRNQVKALVREMQRMHEERDADQPTRVIVLDGSEIPDEGATAEELRGLVDEARMWARHGYEIGQRHCGWADAGVAPAWLTEGWPRHFDSCEHLKQAADLDTALVRVRSLPTEPEVMDAQEPNAGSYLHGYKVAIGDAKHAARIPASSEEADRA
jgi:hypothetical protein